MLTSSKAPLSTAGRLQQEGAQILVSPLRGHVSITGKRETAQPLSRQVLHHHTLRAQNRLPGAQEAGPGAGRASAFQGVLSGLQVVDFFTTQSALALPPNPDSTNLIALLAVDPPKVSGLGSLGPPLLALPAMAGK